MLQRNLSSWQRPRWQQALAEAINNPSELLKLLELPQDALPISGSAARQFPLRVPRSYVARMRKGDPDDPLLRQILPIAAEELESAGFHNDPVGDLKAMPVPGVLHKYRGRVLLITTGACGIHCRYCFRRHFPYGDANPATDDWRPALDYITADSTISEVILSASGSPSPRRARGTARRYPPYQAAAHPQPSAHRAAGTHRRLVLGMAGSLAPAKGDGGARQSSQ